MSIIYNLLKNISKRSLRLGKHLPRQPLNLYLEYSTLIELLRSFDIDCVLDVGANRGQFAKILRDIGYQGYICSFEPIPHDYAELCSQFQGDARWVGYNYALGSQNDIQTFNITIDATNMSSFLAPQDSDWNVSRIDVDVKRLDTIFYEVIEATQLREPKVFLKMDTQGFDLEVIKGSKGCIQQIIGIQSEVSVIPSYIGMPHYLDSIRYYEQLGFELYSLAEATREHEYNRVEEMDCIMMRLPE